MAKEPDTPAGAAHGRLGEPRAVFLSHSSEDAQLAQGLCAALEARGFACWIAPRDIAKGQAYGLGCLQGVAASQSLVLLASEKALGSVQVLSEVEQAHKRSKPIYTVLIPPAKVRGEMDFYISRLHWMSSAGRSAGEIAAELAAVLGREREWNEVAPPPTLRRTMQYRPAAFAKILAAVVLGAVLVLGGAAFALNRIMDLDFRRLGYVVLAAEPTDGGRETMGHAQIWLMANGVRFADVRLKMAVETAGGGVRQQEFSGWLAPEQVGSEEEAAIPLGPGVRRLTTCLIVPNTGLNAPYRVTQRFVMASQGDEFGVSETAEKRVSREDGSPCGAGQ